ncbi:uncharacterized protein [Amphiura filiformis]|uniref:uncharacterized protein n=1 Tax=Amphiura filiformis TaxID=82378 RepID=UPI003B21E83D
MADQMMFLGMVQMAMAMAMPMEIISPSRCGYTPCGGCTRVAAAPVWWLHQDQCYQICTRPVLKSQHSNKDANVLQNPPPQEHKSKNTSDVQERQILIPLWQIEVCLSSRNVNPTARNASWLNLTPEPVIFLSPTASIANAGDAYYTLKLDDGGRSQLYKDDDGSGTTVADDPAVSITSTSFTELCVRVTTDNTIHLLKNDGGGPHLSWQDSALHDINYILVQNYNGDSSNVAEWKFCDGAVTLLTQNKKNMASSLPTSSSGSVS